MTGAYLWLYVLFTLIPFAASVSLLFHANAWQASLNLWRRRLWFVGMGVVTAFSLTLLTKVILIKLSVLPSSAISYDFDYWLTSSLILIPAACISIGFGMGRSRWLGLISAIMTAAYVFIAYVASTVSGI